MNQQTKEVIHDAIARQLSAVFPALGLEIITEVVDAHGGDAGRAAEALQEMSPTPAPAKPSSGQQALLPKSAPGNAFGKGRTPSRRPPSKRRALAKSAPNRRLDPSKSRLLQGDGDDGSAAAISRMLAALALSPTVGPVKQPAAPAPAAAGGCNNPFCNNPFCGGVGGVCGDIPTAPQPARGSSRAPL